MITILFFFLMSRWRYHLTFKMAGEPSDGRHFKRQRSHSLNETTLRLANSTNDYYYYYFPVLLNFIKKDYQFKLREILKRDRHGYKGRIKVWVVQCPLHYVHNGGRNTAAVVVNCAYGSSLFPSLPCPLSPHSLSFSLFLFFLSLLSKEKKQYTYE